MEHQPLLDALDVLTGIGRSDDGLVRVEVDGAGRATAVTLEADAMRLGRNELAAGVLKALRAAYDDVDGQARTVLRATVVEEPGPGWSPDAARADVLRRAEETAGEFEAVRRQLMDRMQQL